MSSVGVLKLTLKTSAAKLVSSLLQQHMQPEQEPDHPCVIFMNILLKALARKRKDPSTLRIELSKELAIDTFNELMPYFHLEGEVIREQNTISLKTEEALYDVLAEIDQAALGRRRKQIPFFQLEEAINDPTLDKAQRSRLRKRFNREIIKYSKPLAPLPPPIAGGRIKKFS